MYFLNKSFSYRIVFYYQKKTSYNLFLHLKPRGSGEMDILSHVNIITVSLCYFPLLNIFKGLKQDHTYIITKVIHCHFESGFVPPVPLIVLFNFY